MRIHLESDAPLIGEVLTDLLQAGGYTVTDGDAAATLAYQSDLLRIITGKGATAMSYLVTPPVHPAELLRLIASKTQGSPALVGLAYGWRFNAGTRSIERDGQTIALTEKECMLLKALTGALPKAVSRDRLLAQAFSYEPGTDTHTLETHIYRLRGKLEQHDPKPCDIVTEEGSYKLVLEAA